MAEPVEAQQRHHRLRALNVFFVDSGDGTTCALQVVPRINQLRV
ncbi:MAG: hypothetical protein SGJ27_26680 [Candidatus Melainabacteria bacterium]|nr:hypothetical protein [Candidatus Melainabacteria bacterium]